MAERKKNKAFWRMMKARHMRPVREYAEKYGLTMHQAELDLTMKAILDREDQEFLVTEGLRWSKDTSSRTHEEE